MKNSQALLKLAHACLTDASLSPQVGRITGLLDAANFSKLMCVLSVESNPRKPKESNVTKEIIETLTVNPERFHLMSKGILISASSCEVLDRNRFRLNFAQNPWAMPGVLDGGHNTFALAKYILSYLLEDAVIRGIKDWEELVVIWQQQISNIESLFESSDNLVKGFSFLIPIEIIYPRDSTDQGLEIWGESHRDITHARNNNIQLTDATKDGHQGFYEELRKALPVSLSERVEWKTNDGGTIRSADVVALSLIPLSCLPASITGIEINRVKIYNSKQYCVETYRKILENKVADRSINGAWQGQTFVLTSLAIKSALRLVPDVLRAYDYLLQNFPDAYNSNRGSFGRIEGVRIFSDDPKDAKDPKYSKTIFPAKFDKSIHCNYQFADGFIIPLVASMRELINFNAEKNELSWAVDPVVFLEKNLKSLLSMYASLLKFSNYDPQKIGKDQGAYDIASGSIKMALQNVIGSDQSLL